MSRGSGITTRQLMNELGKRTVEAYEEQLRSMMGGRVGLKPKQVKDLAAGFVDGQKDMLQHLVNMGIIVYTDDPKDEKANVVGAKDGAG